MFAVVQCRFNDSGKSVDLITCYVLRNLIPRWDLTLYERNIRVHVQFKWDERFFVCPMDIVHPELNTASR